MTDTQPDIDPATLEIIRNALLNVTNEMQASVMHSAYSLLWQEAGDLSNAILTADGSLVAQPDRVIPAHLATMSLGLRSALDELGGLDALSPGDAIIANNPYKGNNHIPDVMVVGPVFAEGEVLAFSAVRGHWLDAGGRYPTSHSPALESSYEEGIILPTTLAYEADELDPDIVELVRYNVRQPEKVLGDLQAQKAGVDRGIERLTALVERYDAATIREAMERILDNSEAEMRAAIGRVPDGVYAARDQIDNDGVRDEPLTIAATVTVEGDRLVVDFADSDPQAVGGVNSPWGSALCSVYYAAITMLTPGTPGTSGTYRPIEVTAPEGSIVNPTFPAPVVAGNHETGTRITDVVVRALGEAVPENAYAAGDGSSNVFNYFGTRDGAPFQNTTVHGGGSGAHAGGDGHNVIRNGVGNTGIASVEREETMYPVRVERFEIRPDSGGAGRHRGGLTATKVTQFLADMGFLLVADRASAPPYGLAGGGSGTTAIHRLERADGAIEPLRSKTGRVPVEAGAKLHFTAAGGGGFGDPRERDPLRVVADVRDGYVSRGAARDTYGVVLREIPDGVELDAAATAALRGGV
jgi:N-methylhydantoinase B